VFKISIIDVPSLADSRFTSNLSQPYFHSTRTLSRVLSELEAGWAMSTSSVGAVVGTYVSVLVLLIVLASVGSIVTYIIIVVANRAEPDPTGKRTSAIYHAGTAFVALWLELAGVITIFVTLFGLIGASAAPSFSNEVHPLGDATIRGITIGLLLSIVGGYTALTHRVKAIELSIGDESAASPSKRIVRSYAAVVSFISVIVVVVTSLLVLWALLGLIAPGVYQTGGRLADFRLLLDEATVLAVFSWTLTTHRHLVGVH
jgi:hypothetical protein